MDKISELHESFNISFSKIMKQMTPALQKTWNSRIDWPEGKSFPKIKPEVLEGLTPGAKAAYVMMLNNLSRDYKKLTN